MDFASFILRDRTLPTKLFFFSKLRILFSSTAIGSVLTKSLDNLENLVQIPTGCGEQNMVKFAPNIVVLDVFTRINQLSEKVKNKIIRNLNVGTYKYYL